MFSRRPLFLAALLAGALSAPVPAQVIDDFEAGAFSLVSPPGSSAGGVQGSLPVFHCLAGERYVEILSNGPDPADAQLNVTLFPDEVTTVFPSAGGSLQLVYDYPVPVDLTDGGQSDRIRARVTVAPGGIGADPFGFLKIRIRDSAASEAVGTRAIDGPGNYDFYFSVSWPGVDPTDVERAEVTLTTGTEGDFHLADLRAMGVLEETMLFQGVDPTAAGPPYPSDPLVLDALVPPEPCAPTVPPDPCTPVHLETHAMSFLDVEPHLIGVSDLQFHWTAAHPFTTTVDGLESEIFWTPYGGEGFPDTARLTFSGAVTPASSTQVAIEDARVFLHGLSGVSKKVQMVHTEGAFKSQVWRTEATLTAEIGPNQPLQIADAGLVSIDSYEMEWFVTLVLQAAAEAQGINTTVNPESAVLRLQYTGTATAADWILGTDPEPAPEPGRLLRADPVVGRSTVVFRLAQAAPAGGAHIEILDVRGRRVRLLELEPGAQDIRWDGHDSAGRIAASGVYLARVVGEADTSLKLVRLR